MIREGYLDQSGPPPIQPRPIPSQLWVIAGDNYKKKTRTDAYGAELTFLYAYELRAWDMGDDVAIKAYINALPNDTPIILFWH